MHDSPNPDHGDSSTSEGSAKAVPYAYFHTGIPVVGIGCSAGGLAPLEALLGHVPKHSGAAFVVIQHLAPHQSSALPSLLQRVTDMQVVEASEGQPIKPNRVYVITPGCDLLLQNGRLHLQAPSKTKGVHLPIDTFLCSLAEERRHLSIGIVLSGMGSDGVAGLRAIRQAGGFTLAQDPATAVAPSMPQSAIEAGLVDIVAGPDDLPKRLAEHLGQSLSDLREHPEWPSGQQSLDSVTTLLRDHLGNDFALYKTSTLLRRIERRVTVHQLDGIEAYVDFLRRNPHEIDLLFKELLIGVTQFFRDPDVWDFLASEALPELLALYPEGKQLRAWVPACSSGEEVYTLAMVFMDVIEQTHPHRNFQLIIYGTDLDIDAVERARKGLFPLSIEDDLTPERLERYFVKDGNQYRIQKKIRDMVVFAKQNIISDPPFTKLDILSCRNLLIYFRSELQDKLLPLFHYALNPGGLLLLGSAETVGNLSQRFAPLHNKNRVFRRLAPNQQMSGISFPTVINNDPAQTPKARSMDQSENYGSLVEQWLLRNFSPPAVLVNGEGDILFVNGRTGKYLEPAAGKFDVNIHAMAREGLREALTGLIRKALVSEETLRIAGLRVGTNGGTQIVNLTVQPITSPESLRGQVAIVFHDVPTVLPNRRRKKSDPAAEVEPLSLELEQVRETLRVTHEEMQSSVEELKSSNEELQSTNEELQSTNEELTTSKEEMQSLNEELQTVNSELLSKVDELSWLRNDMTNLLNSTEIATIFLDHAANLRRFTSQATKLFKLIPGDVGRPISHVVSDLQYAHLKDDVEAVLSTLVFKEFQAGTEDGRWFRVRIMPYRTHDNVIDGVVITFIDISEIHQLQVALELAQNRNRPAAD